METENGLTFEEKTVNVDKDAKHVNGAMEVHEPECDQKSVLVSSEPVAAVDGHSTETVNPKKVYVSYI